MTDIPFFNFHPMGLGGMWQNISYIFSTVKRPNFILHQDDWNVRRFTEIANCFKKKKYNIVRGPEETFECKHGVDWFYWSKKYRESLSNKYKYRWQDVQMISCILTHRYVETKWNNLPEEDFITVYLQYKDENPDRPRESLYNVDRDLTDAEADKVRNELEKRNIKYIELGPHNDIETNVKLMCRCKFHLGREGGWTHVAHSARKKFYPVMNNENDALKYAHGANYLEMQKFTHVNDIAKLLGEIT